MDFHSHSIRAVHFDFNFQFDHNQYTTRGIGCQQCLHNEVNKFKEREPSPKTPPTSHKGLNTSMELFIVPVPVSKRARAEHPRIINLKTTESIVIEDYSSISISIYTLANNKIKDNHQQKKAQ